MKKIALIGLVALAPVTALAQDLGGVTQFVTQIGNILELLLPIVVTLAVLYFFWGLAQFIFNSGSDDAKAEGRNKMIWGIIALFVIVSIWGIIGFLGEIFGIRSGGSAPVPGVNNAEETDGIPAPL